MEELKSGMNEELIKSDKPIKLTPLKIAVAVLYSAVTLFLVITLIDILINPGTWFGLSLALYLVIIVIIMGGIANAVLFLISAITAIVVKVKGRSKMGTLIYFIIFAILPVLTEGIMIATCLIINATLNAG